MYLVSVESLTRLDVTLLTGPEQRHFVSVSYPRYLRQVVPVNELAKATTKHEYKTEESIPVMLEDVHEVKLLILA